VNLTETIVRLAAFDAIAEETAERLNRLAKNEEKDVNGMRCYGRVAGGRAKFSGRAPECYDE